MNTWGAWLAYAGPALLITVIGIFLRRASRDPRTPRGDAILFDLGMGFVAIIASVLWLQVLVSVVF